MKPGLGPPYRLKRLAFLVAVIYVAFFASYMWLVHGVTITGEHGQTGTIPGEIWQLAVFGLTSGLALFLLVWRFNLALWKAAQADAARAEAERRLETLLAGGRPGPPTAGTERDTRAERVQAAIYSISEAASSTTTLQELFRAIHAAVGELMPARNSLHRLVRRRRR